ncbi:MAG TPA: hypothetical protein VFI65_30210 [Streptosporangiaceae bacterium]|nr:hypothetical protein [Streptosporangiaceae bacterium]
MTTSSEVDLPPDAPADAEPAPAKPSSGSRFAGLAGLREQRFAQPAIVAIGILLLAVAYLLQARTMPQISEGSSQALQGWDMLHGNVLLHGWSLSDVSFYTTEIPQYALVEAIKGLNGFTVPLAAAISYFLQVVMAGFLAKGRATGREGWTRALIAVGIMLAPPLGPATALLMASPDHAGTHVPLLLIYLILDRVRPRWWLPILITILLAWATIADALVLVEGTLPIAAVCAVRMYRRRGPWRAQLYDLSLVVGAGLSVELARVVLKLVEHAGGFYVRTPIAAFGTPDQVAALLWTKIENILLIFGADFFGKIVNGNVIVAFLHLIAVAMVVWALAAVIRRFYVEEDQILQMLTLAFVVVFGAYLLGTKPDSNEIVGLLPIGAVVAGRALGGRVIKLRLVPVLAALFATFSIFLIGNASAPAHPNANNEVAVWLQQHHYTYGLGGYWNASSITAETGGKVNVRPIRTYQNYVLTTNFENNVTWFDPTKHYANFVVWIQNHHCGNLCLTKEGLDGAFGPPKHTYYVGNYIVFKYDHNLLPQVPYLSFCGTAWPWVAKGAPTTNLACNAHA